MEKRATDYGLIADTAANKEAISNIKEDISEMRDDIHELSMKIDTNTLAVNAKLDAVIAGITAQKNQFLGAGRLVKFLWFAFPGACALAGYFAARVS